MNSRVRREVQTIHGVAEHTSGEQAMLAHELLDPSEAASRSSGKG